MPVRTDESWEVRFNEIGRRAYCDFTGRTSHKLQQELIKPNSVSGTIFLNDAAIQLFSIDSEGVFRFMDLVETRHKAQTHGSRFYPGMGLVTLQWDACFLGNCYIMATYEYDCVTARGKLEVCKRVNWNKEGF